MFGQIKFTDLGRSKFSGTVEIKNEKELLAECKKHLMSRDLSYSYEPATNTGQIFAGFAMVGTFTVIKQ